MCVYVCVCGCIHMYTYMLDAWFKDNRFINHAIRVVLELEIRFVHAGSRRFTPLTHRGQKELPVDLSSKPVWYAVVA